MLEDHAALAESEWLSLVTARVRDALLDPQAPASATLAVHEVARCDLVEIHPDAELFEALALMLRRGVDRLLVRDGAQRLGVLGPADVMSFIANHSQIVARQIDAAANLADLTAAGARIDAMVALLHAGGTPVERIARRVGELNARLFARLWSLLAPQALVENSCLIVMGSEGRGEQIVKTDQDNALLLRDGFEPADLGAITARFNAALAALGYPPCPGDIMLTNPLWCQPLAAFRAKLGDWIYAADPDGPMHLAIFLDALTVAGDASLLHDARDHLDHILAGSDAFLARFAAAADQFDDASHWWSRWTPRRDDTPLDLKKLGTFPIVHGARALALQHRVRAPGTVERLRELAACGVLEPELTRDLIDALHCLMALKLAHQLAARGAGQVPDNLVRPADLGTFERDALHVALAIVKRFRVLLAQRFRLDAL